MRLFCFGCGKCVSNQVPDDTVVRAVTICPECIPRWIREDVKWIGNQDVINQVVEKNKS